MNFEEELRKHIWEHGCRLAESQKFTMKAKSIAIDLAVNLAVKIEEQKLRKCPVIGYSRKMQCNLLNTELVFSQDTILFIIDIVFKTEKGTAIAGVEVALGSDWEDTVRHGAANLFHTAIGIENSKK
jgi:hypothetical protein